MEMNSINCKKSVVEAGAIFRVGRCRGKVLVNDLVDEVIVAVGVVEAASKSLSNLAQLVMLPADEDIARIVLGIVVDGVLR